MTETVLEVGDKLHIMTRRRFEQELRRHFVGEVIAYDKPLAKLKGFAYILNTVTSEYRRLPEERTKIIAIGESGYIVNKIPRSTKLGDVEYRLTEDRLVVTDGSDFSLSVNEYGLSR